MAPKEVRLYVAVFGMSSQQWHSTGRLAVFVSAVGAYSGSTADLLGGEFVFWVMTVSGKSITTLSWKLLNWVGVVSVRFRAGKPNRKLPRIVRAYTRP
jgi:ribosomal protein L35AE/L33A